jgi:hypothetical protein
MIPLWPTDEQSSESPIFENAGQGVVELHETGEGRPGGGNRKKMKQEPGGDGDFGKWQYCFAIVAGRVD